MLRANRNRPETGQLGRVVRQPNEQVSAIIPIEPNRTVLTANLKAQFVVMARRHPVGFNTTHRAVFELDHQKGRIIDPHWAILG